MRLDRAGYAGIFALTILIAGSCYWATSEETDWWAGFHDADRGFVPKFKFSWYEQAIVCGIIGVLYAVPITAGIALVYLGWRHLRGESPAAAGPLEPPADGQGESR
ncbi:MAG TPA: hypothetical protein VKE74_15470 [Gemmataceae bacterium]|nr:hypothetical protein [Gemmataceae bacterium]